MASTDGDRPESKLAAEIEVEAYRRLFPLPYYQRHLAESVRPDGRALGQARDTAIALGPVSSANGSALVKIGDTTVLAAIKLEVMTPSTNAPDEGSLAVDFCMPPICSPAIRPGRPADAAPVIAKQITDAISSSGMINLKELSLVSGKAAWMVYLDIYCLNADGSLFDAALLSATAAFYHLQIPLVSLNDDGRVITVSEEKKGKAVTESLNKEIRKLTISNAPFSLTCILHDKYILADPTSEEESVMDTHVTVVLDSKGRLVSSYKAGGSVLLSRSMIKSCMELAKQRMEELGEILKESLSAMEID